MADWPAVTSACRRSDATLLSRSARMVRDLRQLELLSELTNVATFELELASGTVHWRTPLAGALKDLRGIEKFSIASGTGERFLCLEELASALLAPVTEVLRAGIACESYELVQPIKTPAGEERQMLVRVVPIEGGCFLGILADISDPRESPWVVADVADRLQLLVEHSPDGIIVHQDGRVVYANPAAAALVGEPSPRLGLGKVITSYLHPDHVAPTIARLSQLQEPGSVVKGYEAVLRRLDGSDIAVEVASARTTWGGKVAYQVILRDISERKKAEAERESRLAVERQYAAAVESLEEGVVVIGAGGCVVAANESARRVLGKRLERGRWDQIFTGGKRARDEDGNRVVSAELPIRRALSEQTPISDYILGVSNEGGDRQWLSVNVRPVSASANIDRVAVCSVSDITARKQLVDRLEWEARNDPLTELLNRNGFLASVRSLMASTAQQPQDVVLFFFDLDRFKLVNDSLGHHLGDEVLQVVARRLRKEFAHAVCIGRLRGDEFVALESAIADTDAALQRAEHLRSEMSRPIKLSTGRMLTVTPSVGIVRLADVAGDAAEVILDADVAMQQAKSLPGGGVALFEASLREETEARLELEHDLRSAIGNGELRLEYQPIASLSTNRIVGFEALARWEHPRRGLLSPALFIPLAEESALINSLGEWALETACLQMVRWQRQYREASDCYVTVNVSAQQLSCSSFPQVVENILRESGLSAGSLMLELTESGLIRDSIDIVRLLRELRGLGVRLSIDDFGTGFSSLSYLKHLPVNALKVDRSFVSGFGRCREDERIAASIVELAHGLHLRVVAEGVEDRQQRLVAQQLDCDLYQGYLLSRPCRARDVPVFWPSNRKEPARRTRRPPID